MTRAKHELILSFHGTASRWVSEVGETVFTTGWADVEEFDSRYVQGIPEVIGEVEPRPGASEVLSMRGLEFIYTTAAIGLSQHAQEKLVDLVTGRERSRRGTRERWVNVGSLFDDLSQSKLHDRITGPAVAQELRELAALIGRPSFASSDGSPEFTVGSGRGRHNKRRSDS